MPDFLLFRLYGAMAAWGEVAVGERRASLGYPGKSSIMGLIAGALGVRRDEPDRLMALHQGYGVAVRFYPAASRLFDYHTAQTPPRNKQGYATRSEELSAAKLNTVLSSREYLLDALSDVAVWAKPSAFLALSSLKEALERPHFAPYLGRKSCPPALPYQPQIIAADGLVSAFAAADETWSKTATALRFPRPQGAPRLVWEEGVVGVEPKIETKQRRRDQYVRPQSRLFTERFECHGAAI